MFPPGMVSGVVSEGRSRAAMPMTPLAGGALLVSRIGLGLAALGRPAYITSGRDGDLPDRSVSGLRARTFQVLDAAYQAGVRYVDAARSYGRAEEFLGAWLAERGHADVVAGSKWGYRYTGDWRLDAPRHEVKEHSLPTFRTQLAQTRVLLGSWLRLYQVHSLTRESGLLGNRPLVNALAELRDEGVLIGLTTSGPGQAEVIRRALDVVVGGRPLFAAAQVTWNVLETSAGAAAAEAAAAGWTILVKEALANGRLAPGGDSAGKLAGVAAEHGVTADAVALAVTLANPWASVVLSGAATVAQLRSNVTALSVRDLRLPDLAERPEAYWTTRAARPWR